MGKTIYKNNKPYQYISNSGQTTQLNGSYDPTYQKPPSSSNNSQSVKYLNNLSTDQKQKLSQLTTSQLKAKGYNEQQIAKLGTYSPQYNSGKNDTIVVESNSPSDKGKSFAGQKINNANYRAGSYGQARQQNLTYARQVNSQFNRAQKSLNKAKAGVSSIVNGTRVFVASNSAQDRGKSFGGTPIVSNKSYNDYVAYQQKLNKAHSYVQNYIKSQEQNNINDKIKSRNARIHSSNNTTNKSSQKGNPQTSRVNISNDVFNINDNDFNNKYKSKFIYKSKFSSSNVLSNLGANSLSILPQRGNPYAQQIDQTSTKIPNTQGKPLSYTNKIILELVSFIIGNGKSLFKGSQAYFSSSGYQQGVEDAFIRNNSNYNQVIFGEQTPTQQLKTNIANENKLIQSNQKKFQNNPDVKNFNNFVGFLVGNKVGELLVATEGAGVVSSVERGTGKAIHTGINAAGIKFVTDSAVNFVKNPTSKNAANLFLSIPFGIGGVKGIKDIGVENFGNEISNLNPKNPYKVTAIDKGSEIHKGGGFDQFVAEYKGDTFFKKNGKTIGARRVKKFHYKNPSTYFDAILNRKPGTFKKIDTGVQNKILIRDVPSQYATPQKELELQNTNQVISHVTPDDTFLKKSLKTNKPYTVQQPNPKTINSPKGREATGGIETGMFFAPKTNTDIKLTSGKIIPKGTPQTYIFYSGISKSVGFSDLFSSKINLKGSKPGIVFGESKIQSVKNSEINNNYNQLSQDLAYNREPGTIQLSASTLKGKRTESEVIKTPQTQSIVTKKVQDIYFPGYKKPFSLYNEKIVSDSTPEYLNSAKKANIDYLQQRITQFQKLKSESKSTSPIKSYDKLIQIDQRTINKLYNQNNIKQNNVNNVKGSKPGIVFGESSKKPTISATEALTTIKSLSSISNVNSTKNNNIVIDSPVTDIQNKIKYAKQSRINFNPKNIKIKTLNKGKLKQIQNEYKRISSNPGQARIIKYSTDIKSEKTTPNSSIQFQPYRSLKSRGSKSIRNTNVTQDSRKPSPRRPFPKLSSPSSLVTQQSSLSDSFSKAFSFGGSGGGSSGFSFNYGNENGNNSKPNNNSSKKPKSKNNGFNLFIFENGKKVKFNSISLKYQEALNLGSSLSSSYGSNKFEIQTTNRAPGISLINFQRNINGFSGVASQNSLIFSKVGKKQ